VRTLYPFTLPRGYLAPDGTLHRDGVMRLATGRDELEPLRDAFVTGADDPRLTILVLARVVERLGTISYVTANEIENLFAADLAFLQEFYSVVNFGDQESYEALLRHAGRPRQDLVEPAPVDTDRSVVTLDSPAEPAVGPAGPDRRGPAAPDAVSGAAPDAVAAPAPEVPGRVPGAVARRDAILEVVGRG
jgi:hypothetical protein